MTDINFYHLTRSDLEQTLPELLQKTMEKGWNAVVLVGSTERSEYLTNHLWTFRPDSFIPHGNAKDGNAEMQQIWITHTDERPNNAEALFLIDGMVSSLMGEFERVSDIFDGNDETAVAAARERWKKYKALGYAPAYWQQNERGWTKQD